MNSTEPICNEVSNIVNIMLYRSWVQFSLVFPWCFALGQKIRVLVGLDKQIMTHFAMSSIRSSQFNFSMDNIYILMKMVWVSHEKRLSNLTLKLFTNINQVKFLHAHCCLSFFYLFSSNCDENIGWSHEIHFSPVEDNWGEIKPLC